MIFDVWLLLVREVARTLRQVAYVAVQERWQ
jgi:hypothetical protein